MNELNQIEPEGENKMLPIEVRITLEEGLESRMNFVEFSIKVAKKLSNPNMSIIVQELDGIKYTIDYIRKEFFINNLESKIDKLNQLKETTQWMISSEVL